MGLGLALGSALGLALGHTVITNDRIGAWDWDWDGMGMGLGWALGSALGLALGWFWGPSVGANPPTNFFDFRCQMPPGGLLRCSRGPTLPAFSAAIIRNPSKHNDISHSSNKPSSQMILVLVLVLGSSRTAGLCNKTALGIGRPLRGSLLL